MDNLITPMTEEKLRETHIEIVKDFWLEPDVEDDMHQMLEGIKDHTCETGNSPIKKLLAIHWASANHTALLIDGVLIDAFSASAVYQVARYLRKNNKKDLFFKIFSKDITTIAKHCLKCCK